MDASFVWDLTISKYRRHCKGVVYISEVSFLSSIGGVFCPPAQPTKAASGTQDHYTVTGPKIQEVSQRLKDLLQRFPTLIQRIPEGTIFRFDEEVNQRSAMAMVSDDHTIFVGDKFLETITWKPNVDLSTDPDLTVQHFVNVGNPDQLPLEYHQLAAIYQEHGQINHPSFQTMLNSLPQTEQLKALRVSIHLALYKTFQRESDISAGGVVAHEATHIRQNRESNGLCQYADTWRGNASRIGQLGGVYPSYIAEKIEQPAYVAGDRFLKDNRGTLEERRNLLMGYFPDIYQSENTMQYAQDAYDRGSIEFRSILKELFPKYINP